MCLTLFLVVNQVLVPRNPFPTALKRQGIIHKFIAIFEVSVRVGLHMAHDVIIDGSPKEHEA